LRFLVLHLLGFFHMLIKAGFIDAWSFDITDVAGEIVPAAGMLSETVPVDGKWFAFDGWHFYFSVNLSEPTPRSGLMPTGEPLPAEGAGRSWKCRQSVFAFLGV
jgi:hypothetical protein